MLGGKDKELITVKTIVGIDASLTGTGVVALENGELHTHTRIESKQTGVKRLVDIENHLRNILDNLLLMQSDLVLIEGYAYAAQNQAHQIGELGGVIRRMLHKMMVRWIEVNPSQVKKFATGKGNAKKEQIILQVYKHWGAEFKSNDEADAFVLAKIGQALFGTREQLTKYQEEVIAELRKKYQGVLGSEPASKN